MFWLSCTKGHDNCGWSGYEAFVPLRAGLIMRVIGKNGEVEFEEIIEQNSWNPGNHAKKVGLFSWEEKGGQNNDTET